MAFQPGERINGRVTTEGQAIQWHARMEKNKPSAAPESTGRTGSVRALSPTLHEVPGSTVRDTHPIKASPSGKLLRKSHDRWDKINRVAFARIPEMRSAPLDSSLAGAARRTAVNTHDR